MTATTAHPAPELLELYVLGSTSEIPVETLEAHLRICPTCTDRLRSQVQLEQALGEAGTAARFCPGCDSVLLSSRCEACGAIDTAGGLRIERLLVQNARGRLYLARGPQGETLALKELAFIQAPHPDALDAFEREARLLRQLDHPQIPRFWGSFREGQGVSTRLYLAQEFVEGESLDRRLEHHRFTEAEVRELAAQVLGILEYLQGLSPKVFHRDIKPANLVRRPDGQIALVDFGAARDLGATVGATLVGTFGYMPIEQMGGIVDVTTDLYALGATLCHLLSRREPWSLLEDPRAFDRLDVSPAFAGFLRKLTARQSPDRFPSAAAASAALRTLGKTTRPRGRWPRLPAAAAVAGAVLVMGLAFSLVLLPLATTGARSEKKATSPPSGTASGGGAMLDPSTGSGLLAIDPTQAPYRLILPAHLARTGTTYWALVKLCVSAGGDVVSVRIIKPSSSPAFDAALPPVLGRWRYRPYLVNGQPVPFCYTLRYGVEAR